MNYETPNIKRDPVFPMITEKPEKIILLLKNKSNERKLFSLFSVLNLSKFNYGIPKEVSTEAFAVWQGKNKKHDYESLIKNAYYLPFVVRITKTTNNRQLYFFTIDMFGSKWPIEPTLTINKHHRPQKRNKIEGGFDYIDKWSPDKWNIADTGEYFALDNNNIIEIELLPKQIFEIVFKPHETKRITDYKI